MVWESSASPTCRPNGPASTRCSGFQRNSSDSNRVSADLRSPVARKRDFQGGETGADTLPEPQIRVSETKVLARKPRQLRALCTAIGNFRNCASAWWGWKDSNLQPERYERTSPAPQTSEFFRPTKMT